MSKKELTEELIKLYEMGLSWYARSGDIRDLTPLHLINGLCYAAAKVLSDYDLDMNDSERSRIIKQYYPVPQEAYNFAGYLRYGYWWEPPYPTSGKSKVDTVQYSLQKRLNYLKQQL